MSTLNAANNSGAAGLISTLAPGGDMLNPWNIFFSVIFGLIGAVYIVYGKNTTSLPFMICGLLLIVYTFFVSTTAEVIWYGLALLAAAFVLNKLFS